MKNNHLKDRRRFHLSRKKNIQVQNSRKLIWVLLSWLLLILPINFRPQTVELDKIPKSNSQPVKIPIIVSDREGRRIPGLKKEDFTLFQDERKQKITTFASEDEPINIALLIDTSGSTQGALDKIKASAQEFIELLNPADECLIATFDSKVKILLPLTLDRQALKSSLNKIQTAELEGTVMFNAVNQIVKNSFSEARGRKAIILLSDGKDFGSTVSRTDLLNELQESDLSIYAILYPSGIGFNKLVINLNGMVAEGKETEKPKKETKPKIKKKGYTILIPLPADTYTKEEIKLLDQTSTIEALNSLKEITELTAGRLYMSDTKNLSLVFKQVADELRQVYLLGFEGSSNDTDVHNIMVKVARPGVVVNSRNKIVTK